MKDRIALYGLLMKLLKQPYESILKMPEHMAGKLIDWYIKAMKEQNKKGGLDPDMLE